MHTPHIAAAFRAGSRFFAIVLATLTGFSGMTAASASSGSGRSASTHLKVTGRLVPGACTVHLAGSGMVSYGDIPRKNVPDDEPLKLGVRSVQFTVTCEDPMIIKVTARDEKSGTAVLGLVPGEDDLAFGLGSVNDSNIGQFRIQSVPGTFFGQDAEGQTAPVDILYAYADRPSWGRSDNPYFWSSGETRLSFASPGRLEPGAYRSVTGTFQIETYINRRARLPGGSLPLAGLATVEIFY
ncbi:DUF1120 domain-containing protein [Herbaspirillum sp. alder98]|uniref:DUF1120 domain-containing protein n=1 Tax=Herbaspirillum sp. alder98 TaxID=2913096 RepID=UPI001CD8B81F|nr:DUF1120 domain-containing protein [Herbaspirillum sp. alder98]MCA1323965.1 DUF1120 domain-containing protein [Herbaspirillum sp. alder98]